MFDFFKHKRKEKSKEEVFAAELFNPNGPNDDVLSGVLVGEINFQKIYEKAQEIKPGWLDHETPSLGILEAVACHGCYQSTKKLLDSGVPLGSTQFLSTENQDVLELCWQHGGRELSLEEVEYRFYTDKNVKTDILHSEIANLFEDISAENDYSTSNDFSKLRWMLAKCDEVDGGEIDWSKIDTKDIWSSASCDAVKTSVEKDKPKMIQEMLDAGLDKNEVFFSEIDKSVETPLSMMVSNNNISMAELLLKKHANLYQYLNIGGKNYPTILDFVREKGSPEMIQMFKDNLKGQKTPLARLEPKKEVPVQTETHIPGIKTPEEMAESIARINTATRNWEQKKKEVDANGERLRQLRYGDLAPRRKRSEEQERTDEHIHSHKLDRGRGR